MKQFTEIIKIEVEVQGIADLLLKQFPEDYKHRELVTEAIIATASGNNTIGYIYNALCGFTPDINFQVGDKVVCTDHGRRVNIFEEQTTNPGMTGEEIKNMKPVFKTSDSERIGVCEIIEIDLYRGDKLKVKFMQDAYRSKEQEESYAWVNHKKCERVAQSPALSPVDTK
jgi:hypothetical protein